MGLSSFNFFCGGLRKTNLFWNRMRIGRSRSSKFVDFGTNRKSVCDFLLVTNSNFAPISHQFWDTASYWLKLRIFPTPPSFGTFLWGDPLRIIVARVKIWSRDPDHVHLGAILCINFVVLFRPKHGVKLEWSIVNGCKIIKRCIL